MYKDKRICDKRKKQLCLSYFKIDQKICEFINNVDSVEEESLTDYLLWKMKEVDKRVRHANVRKKKKATYPVLILKWRYG